MAPGSAWLLVLGSSLVTSCSGETLNAVRSRPAASQASPGNGDEGMLKSLEAIADAIAPKNLENAAIVSENSQNLLQVIPAEAGVEDAFKRLSSSFKGKAMMPFAIPVNENSIAQDFTSSGQDTGQSLYGELVPPSAAFMMLYALAHHPKIAWDGQEDHRYEIDGRRPKFLDLGSGFGKISMLAALLGFDAGGYELTGDRTDAACGALHELAGGASSEVAQQQHDGAPVLQCALDASQGHGRLEFFKGSFTHKDVDLADVDVIFTDSVILPEDTMKLLGEKASKMKPGSIIFTYKSFPGDGSFGTLQTLNLPSSWSDSVTYQVQEVNAQVNPQDKSPVEVQDGSLRGSARKAPEVGGASNVA